MHLLEPSTHVSAVTSFTGTYIPMHVFEKGEKGKIMKLSDSISELIFNIFIRFSENSCRREVLT